MPHRVFYNVDLTAWVCGTIESIGEAKLGAPPGHLGLIVDGLA